MASLDDPVLPLVAPDAGAAPRFSWRLSNFLVTVNFNQTTPEAIAVYREVFAALHADPFAALKYVVRYKNARGEPVELNAAEQPDLTKPSASRAAMFDRPIVFGAIERGGKRHRWHLHVAMVYRHRTRIHLDRDYFQDLIRAVCASKDTPYKRALLLRRNYWVQFTVLRSPSAIGYFSKTEGAWERLRDVYNKASAHVETKGYERKERGPGYANRDAEPLDMLRPEAGIIGENAPG